MTYYAQEGIAMLVAGKLTKSKGVPYTIIKRPQGWEPITVAALAQENIVVPTDEQIEGKLKPKKGLFDKKKPVPVPVCFQVQMVKEYPKIFGIQLPDGVRWVYKKSLIHYKVVEGMLNDEPKILLAVADMKYLAQQKLGDVLGNMLDPTIKKKMLKEATYKMIYTPPVPEVST